ncbi:MAG: ChbG/HpnK family deacetylase [Solirubrobacterales bacterium]
MKPDDAQVVLHADDLGFSRGTNAGIHEAAERGLLSSSSLLANGPAFEQAVRETIPACSGMGVGVHLNLTEGPTLTRLGSGSLLGGSDGRFRASFGSLLARSRASSLRAEIEQELRAQIEQVLSRLTVVDHLNSHEHVHAIPSIFELVCRLAGDYEIPFVRLPRESAAVALAGAEARPWYTLNLVKVGVLDALAEFNSRTASRLETRVNDWFIGVAHTGRMDAEAAIAGLAALPNESAGVAELLFHPAVAIADRAERYVSARARDRTLEPQRRQELEALCDQRLASQIERLGLAVTCFGCLSGRSDHDHQVRVGAPAVPKRISKPPPLRTFAIVDDDPLYHPTYLQRLVCECEDIELVGAAVVRRPGGTGPERYMRSQIRRLRPSELFRLSIKQVGPLLRRRFQADPPGSAVTATLARHGVPARIVASVNDEHFLDHVRGFAPDLVLSSNSLIFKPPLLELPRITCINRHSALLPAYGGVLPVFRAVQKGEPFAGVSVHRMVPGIDEGEVLARRWIPIYPGDSLQHLYEICYQLSFDVTAEAAARLRSDPQAPGLDDEGLTPSYYSWPDEADWEEFRARGGRLA